MSIPLVNHRSSAVDKRLSAFRVKSSVATRPQWILLETAGTKSVARKIVIAQDISVVFYEFHGPSGPVGSKPRFSHQSTCQYYNRTSPICSGKSRACVEVDIAAQLRIISESIVLLTPSTPKPSPALGIASTVSALRAPLVGHAYIVHHVSTP